MAQYKEKISLWCDPAAVQRVVEALSRSQVILSTTDTVLGLLAPLTHEAKMHLDTIKKRNTKPYLILVRSLAALKEFIEPISDFHIENLMKGCWPGPLTIIFKAKQTVPQFMVSPEGTIAVRIPDHPGLQAILSQYDGLFSTSANITGDPIPTTITDVDPSIINAVAYIVDDGPEAKQRIDPERASTILDCSRESITLVRSGAYPIAQLEKSAGIRFS
jgi:L-threonylcarbamoyladenylate synthase